MKSKPHVGQIVKLNDEGMKIIGGLRSADMIQQAFRMVITHVGDSLTDYSVPTYPIKVNQPLIDKFLIDHSHVDALDEPYELYKRCDMCLGIGTLNRMTENPSILIMVECPNCKGVGNLPITQ